MLNSIRNGYLTLSKISGLQKERKRIDDKTKRVNSWLAPMITARPSISFPFLSAYFFFALLFIFYCYVSLVAAVADFFFPFENMILWWEDFRNQVVCITLPLLRDFWMEEVLFSSEELIAVIIQILISYNNEERKEKFKGCLLIKNGLKFSSCENLKGSLTRLTRWKSQTILNNEKHRWIIRILSFHSIFLFNISFRHQSKLFIHQIARGSIGRS